MSRLIDADAIKTVDYSGLAFISPDDYKKIADYFYQQLIVNQPTAYDVDKVVDQIKKYAAYLDDDNDVDVVVEDLISVVEEAVKVE